MKKSIVVVLCTATVMMFTDMNSYAASETYDFANMTTVELEDVKAAIDSELKQNHSASSDQQSKVKDATKTFVEDLYGSENVDWAWFDYSYTKDWNFYTLDTHADIRKQDGGKAQYDIYSEVFANGDNYQITYVRIGTEEVLNKRGEIITDQRVLRMLGLSESAIEEVKEDEEASDAHPEAETKAAEEPPVNQEEQVESEEETSIAKRGDHSDQARAVQEMLSRLGYLSGTPDGAFGEKTEEAVKKFQAENGFESNGIVTNSVFEAMTKAAENAPEPEEVITISAIELYNQFDNNKIAAEDAYKGKTIQVSGTIEKIDESWGIPYVSIRADDYGWCTVNCNFEKEDKSELAGLNSGQKITIKGTCGSMGFMSVTVEKCSIVE